MKFPYPENPNDWQTAYTREDAFSAYGKYAMRSGMASLTIIIVLIYLGSYLAYKFNFSSLQPYFKIGLVIGLLILVMVLFTVIQWAAFRFASKFIVDFYHPAEGINPDNLISNRLYGKPKMPPPLNMLFTFPFIIAKEGEILKPNEWPAWSARFLGGPISLIVFDGCALYLERGNRFSRIVGPGEKIPFLEWYETIKYVVDLRPKVKEGEFDAWTKDGIIVKVKIQVECRIGNPQNHDPASKLVYPYDPVAVKKAIERHSVRWTNRLEGEPAEFNWLDAVWGQVTGIVPDYIRSRMLDDLLIENRKSGQILSPNAVQDIFTKLNDATRNFGVYVTDFQVLEVKLPKAVVEAQNNQWKAEKESLATVIEGETKAYGIRAREKARADAQYDIILAIAEGLEKNKNSQFTEPLLLSLSGVLDESLREPLTRAYLAKETLETLEKLQNLLEKPSTKD